MIAFQRIHETVKDSPYFSRLSQERFGFSGLNVSQFCSKQDLSLDFQK